MPEPYITNYTSIRRQTRVEKTLDHRRNPANLTSPLAPNITDCMNVIFLDALDEETDNRKYKGEAAPAAQIHQIVNVYPSLRLLFFVKIW